MGNWNTKKNGLGQKQGPSGVTKPQNSNRGKGPPPMISKEERMAREKRFGDLKRAEPSFPTERKHNKDVENNKKYNNNETKWGRKENNNSRFNRPQGRDDMRMARGKRGSKKRNTKGLQSKEKRSKYGRKLTSLLRHNAQEEGFSVRPDGYVPVEEIFSHGKY